VGDMKENLYAQLAKSHDFAAALDSAIDGLTHESDRRIGISRACYRLAREHHFGIIKLIELDACASAFALTRIQYEAFVRGTWLRVCVGENDINQFQTGAHKKLDKMFREIKNVDNSWPQQLGHFQVAINEGLSDYVHSGSRAAYRQIASNSIEPTIKSAKSPKFYDLLIHWVSFPLWLSPKLPMTPTSKTRLPTLQKSISKFPSRMRRMAVGRTERSDLRRM
jgi:hypothetical protein